MGFKSVPFLRFFPPLPLAAEAATLAICFPLLKTAFVMSTLSIVFFSIRDEWRGGGGEWERAGKSLLQKQGREERGKREEATRIKRRRGYRKENDIEEREEEEVKLS